MPDPDPEALCRLPVIRGPEAEEGQILRDLGAVAGAAPRPDPARLPQFPERAPASAAL